jgi:hypothetical protein
VHRLTAHFVLAYHGCVRSVGERLLAGEQFRPSDNDYDWLGPGAYFWEANPERALQFASEAIRRRREPNGEPFVVGAVIELGNCLDLTSATGIDLIRIAYDSLVESLALADKPVPQNSGDLLRRNLDCAVIRRVHDILDIQNQLAADTVKGIFTEGQPIYPQAGFREKTHVQIAVRNLTAIKGVFRLRP